MNRYVSFAFIVAGLLIWKISAELFAYLFSLVEGLIDYHLLGQRFRLTDLIGFILAVSGTIYLYRNKKVKSWGIEVANELKKVTWPTWIETKASTYVVIITVIIFAVILWCFDIFWSAVTDIVYKFKDIKG